MFLIKVEEGTQSQYHIIEDDEVLAESNVKIGTLVVCFINMKKVKGIVQLYSDNLQVLRDKKAAISNSPLQRPKRAIKKPNVYTPDPGIGSRVRTRASTKIKRMRLTTECTEAPSKGDQLSPPRSNVDFSPDISYAITSDDEEIRSVNRADDIKSLRMLEKEREKKKQKMNRKRTTAQMFLGDRQMCFWLERLLLRIANHLPKTETMI